MCQSRIFCACIAVFQTFIFKFAFKTFRRVKHFIKNIFPRILIFTFGYSLLFQSLYNLMRYQMLWPYPSIGSLLVSMGANYLPILLQAIITYAIIFKVATRSRMWVKIAIDITLPLLVSVAINFLFILITGWKVEWGGTTFNAIMIISGIETAYYIARYKRTREREALAQKQVAEYEYEVLKAQVNPHFLFNSLNLLNSLVARKSENVPNFISSLAAIYRYVLTSADRRQVTVEEELSFLNHYVEILKLRYDSIFNVIIEKKPGKMNCRIIPYTLQLLIENVSKHNVISEESPMTVLINIGEDGIEVSNTICRKKRVNGTRVGVTYLTRLYESRGREFRVEDDGKTFTAFVPYL